MTNEILKKITLPETCQKIALCGGPYNNFEAVKSFLKETEAFEFRFCLGDLGGFGPFPDRTIELIKDSNLICIQGNYDYAVGHSENECGCGYLDTRDRHFSQVSFDYTLKNTSEKHKPWLRSLPQQIELSWGQKKILLCHGSPNEMNEFVWDSETSDAKIKSWLEKFKVDGFCATHSGLPWVREIQAAGFWMNVGVLGRPAHEGHRQVYYATINNDAENLKPRVHPLAYNYQNLIDAMVAENLPIEFSQAVDQGVWTTCSQILPEVERPVQPRLKNQNR